VLVLLLLPTSEPKTTCISPSKSLSTIESRLAGLFCVEASGVVGLFASRTGGGSGSGFSRLFCRLRFRACCGVPLRGGNGADGGPVVLFLSLKAFSASRDGALLSLAESSLAASFFFRIPRKASPSKSDGDLVGAAGRLGFAAETDSESEAGMLGSNSQGQTSSSTTPPCLQQMGMDGGRTTL
jgi:hypothetical protein